MPTSPKTSEDQLIDRFASLVVRRGLVAPVIFFLESVRPMNFLASQTMAFFAPFGTLLFSPQDYQQMQQLLENRDSIERILTRIEALDREAPPRAK